MVFSIFLAPDSIYAEIDSGSVRSRTNGRRCRGMYDGAQTRASGEPDNGRAD